MSSASARNPAAVERVRKLLRLGAQTNPDGTLTHEASSALESAQELMAKHGLTDYDIEEDIVLIADAHRDVFREALAHAVAVKEHCAAVVSKRGGTAFRGRRMDAEMARETYRHLVAEGELRAQMSPSGHPPPAARELWRLCWWFGYVGTIVDRLLARPKKQRGATPSKEHLPAPVNDALEAVEQLADQISDTVDDVEAVIERLRQAAYAAGQDTGDKVAIAVSTPRQIR